jgi:hypothetical protein
VSSLSVGFGVAVRSERDPFAPNLLSGSVDYMRSLGSGPVVVQVGASGSGELFGRDELNEVHVAVGAVGSGGPILFSLVAGPSLGRVHGSEFDDPAFAGGRSVPVPGVHLAARAVLVVIPQIGVGIEAFAHVNAKLPAAGGRVVLAFGRMPGALVPNPPPTPRRPGP